MDEQKTYERALAQVRALRDFYMHLAVYLCVIGGLALIDWLTEPPGLTWVYFPAVGWGVGLAIHGFTVFGANRLFGPDWEQRKVKELLERERQQRV
jgi:two-component system, LytTR family, sensor kinase